MWTCLRWYIIDWLKPIFIDIRFTSRKKRFPWKNIENIFKRNSFGLRNISGSNWYWSIEILLVSLLRVFSSWWVPLWLSSWHSRNIYDLPFNWMQGTGSATTIHLSIVFIFGQEKCPKSSGKYISTFFISVKISSRF